MDDMPAVEQEARKLEKFDSPAAKFGAWQWLVNLDVDQGRFKKAIEQAGLGLALAKKIGDRSAEASILATLALIDQRIDRNFDRALGKIDEAMRIAVKSGDVAAQRSLLRQKGLLYLDRNSVPEAERTAAELKAMCEKAASKKQIRLYFELLARIELAKKDYSAALEHARQMMALWPAPGPSDLLADAFDMAGDKKRALEEYEKVKASPSVKAGDIGLYLRSFFRLGQLSEALGLRDKAIGYYEKLLDIWKNADPGALVQDAKKGLARLKGA